MFPPPASGGKVVSKRMGSEFVPQPDLHSIDALFAAFSLLALLLVGGLWLRNRSALLSRLFLPGSVVAGIVVLLLGQDVLGGIARAIGGPDSLLANGIFSEETVSIWRSIPSLLINIVFASLFLGKAIPGPAEIWRRAGPVLCYGQTIAWGQYVVGLTLALLVLTPLLGIDPMVGALIEIGFEGGHGTAAGLAPVFDSVGFAGGVDLALGLASVGLIAAIVSGVILINWAKRRDLLLEDHGGEAEDVAQTMAEGFEKLSPAHKSSASDAPIDPMSFTLGLVAASVLIGWGILSGLQLIERLTWGRNGFELMGHVPLFPMAMIGGAIVQMTIAKYWSPSLVDREIVNRVAGVSLDLIIVAALGTLSLTVIADNFLAFLLMAVAGVAWNVVGFIVLAPRLIPGPWFQRGIPNFGQSMGMTVTGIMLYQMADPGNRSGGLERFGYKQLFFEPVVGGGLFTAMSMPLIFEFGPVPVLLLTLAVTVAWLILGRRIYAMYPEDGAGKPAE